MFQDYALFPHLTALQNVAYGLYALNRSESQKVAEMALNRVGLGAMARQYPSTLSGGEQQRVALARAIVPRPQVIMMDEPFSGLDQRLRESIRDETLALLRETRATTLLVTHDPNEALAFADQIFLMGQGRILQNGSPEDLLQRPTSAAVAQFFTSHAIFEGFVKNGTVQTVLGTVPASGLSEGCKVDVLVPPSGFHLTALGRGASATIVENRNLGSLRRLVIKLEGHNAPLLVHSEVNRLGPCGLALNGKHTHIFPVDINV
jgi:iron(III) transport system ATP-binding protein